MFGWRPGIGDPTVYGWLTVAAYALAAAICWLAASRAPPDERRLWLALALAMALLCVNKQLDLQTLFTDIGRTIAKAQGWYDGRRAYQRIFVAALGAAGLVGAGLAVYFARRMRYSLKVALAGLALLGAFVVMRASSFESVDSLLKVRLGSTRINHVLELGGIAIIALGALWSIRGARPDSATGEDLIWEREPTA